MFAAYGQFMDAMGMQGLVPVEGGVSKTRLIWIFRHITKSCHWMYMDGLKSYKRYGTQYMLPTKPIFSGRFYQEMGHIDQNSLNWLFFSSDAWGPCIAPNWAEMSFF